MKVDRDEGQPLRKKVSSSLIEPTLLGYQNAFTKNATEIGWLDITKGGDAPEWQRRWFELKDGVIRHAPSNKESDTKNSIFIPIENIIRLVTDNKKQSGHHHHHRHHHSHGSSIEEGGGGDTSEYLITMKTTHEKITLRAESSDDLNRWVFAFQRSVALAMTKIMLAQANSSMHHSLGLDSADLRQSDANEALFLQEAAANEDDGWDTRRLARTRSIMEGHAALLGGGANKVGTRGGKGGRSMSIDESMLPLPISALLEVGQQSSSAALRVRAYKDRSFGDLSHLSRKVGKAIHGGDSGHASTPSSPLPLSWGQQKSDFSSADSSPRAVIPPASRSGVCGSGDGVSLFQSTESVDNTWRSVDGMSAGMLVEARRVDSRDKEKEKMSPPGHYGMDLSPSRSSESGSLHGENIFSGPGHHQPARERSSSKAISEGSLGLDMDTEGYMFGMDDVDSLENSLEDFNTFGRGRSSSSGNGAGIEHAQSPLSSYLTKPASLRIKFGACTKLGPKTNQEDRFVIIPSLATPAKSSHGVDGYDDESDTYRCENAYAAVYDGHCGAKASTFVNDTLHNMIYEHPFYEYDVELAIRECSSSIDQTFLERARREDIFDGTTAIGAFFHPKSSQRPDSCSVKVEFPAPVHTIPAGEGDSLARQYAVSELHACEEPIHAANAVRQSDTRMTVFNIGDSRAVLCRNGVAICMSEAHCPSRPDETERIEAAKGWITEEKELFVGRLHRMDLSDPDIADQAAGGIQWTTIYRVLGEVSVSRSIGDYPYKGFVPGELVTDFFNWPSEHDMTFNADLVISQPESKHVDIDELCEFVVLASDGLWDVVSNEKAVARVKAALARGESPESAAEELCLLALKLGSGDNTTVIVVQFFHYMRI